MSHSVHERLRELETDVRDLPMLPAGAVRARGRSRGRRQMAVVTAAGAAVVATAGVAFAWPQQSPAPSGDHAVGGPAVGCVLTLPDSPSEVRVRVLDGGAPAALREATAAQLRTRTFTVLAGATGDEPAGTTALRYGPASIGAATLLRAALNDNATMQFDPDRRDATVDLLLGPNFTRLATTTELNQNLATLGVPAAPPQCPPSPGR